MAYSRVPGWGCWACLSIASQSSHSLSLGTVKSHWTQPWIWVALPEQGVGAGALQGSLPASTLCSCPFFTHMQFPHSQSLGAASLCSGCPQSGWEQTRRERNMCCTSHVLTSNDANCVEGRKHDSKSTPREKPRISSTQYSEKFSDNIYYCLPAAKKTSSESKVSLSAQCYWHCAQEAASRFRAPLSLSAGCHRKQQGGWKHVINAINLWVCKFCLNRASWNMGFFFFSQ